MGKRSSIGVFNLAAQGHAMGYTTDLFDIAGNHSADEMRCSLAFDGWVSGQYQFVGLNLLNAGLQTCLLYTSPSPRDS